MPRRVPPVSLTVEARYDMHRRCAGMACNELILFPTSEVRVFTEKIYATTSPGEQEAGAGN